MNIGFRTSVHTFLVAVMVLGFVVRVAADETKRSSPAERRIEQAKGALEVDRTNLRAWNALALAYAQRARETADPSWYERADEALAKGFAIKKGNYEGRRVAAWVLLGKHEFRAALESATELNRAAPDDLMVYAILVDANVELGRYEEAEVAAQWMLDMRPGHVPGLTRAAYLRELFGDADGALQLFESALSILSSRETEDRAWILTQVGRLHRIAGRFERADLYLSHALLSFPGYHYALAEVGHLRLAQGRPDDAIEAFTKRLATAPHPENRVDVAAALRAAGRAEEADKQLEEFERDARAESEGHDNANRELAFHYVEVGKIDRALKVAALEAGRRRDAHTLHALAWTLHAAGRHKEARKEMAAALEVGILDARMLLHAAQIERSCGDDAAAARLLEKALASAPGAACVPAVRDLLATLRDDVSDG